MWVNLDLIKREEIVTLFWICFIRIQNDVNITALNILTRCMFHSFSKSEGALAQKVQNGLIWEVIVTFDRHPAIAVAKLNNKHKTCKKAKKTMWFLCFSSLLQVINMNDTMWPWTTNSVLSVNSEIEIYTSYKAE